jgi:hypothetical protein
VKRCEDRDVFPVDAALSSLEPEYILH